jgi:transposase InsO family protein
VSGQRFVIIVPKQPDTHGVSLGHKNTPALSTFREDFLKFSLQAVSNRPSPFRAKCHKQAEMTLRAGDSVAQVARDEGVSEQTVRKYRLPERIKICDEYGIVRSMSRKGRNPSTTQGRRILEGCACGL